MLRNVKFLLVMSFMAISNVIYAQNYNDSIVVEDSLCKIMLTSNMDSVKTCSCRIQKDAVVQRRQLNINKSNIMKFKKPDPYREKFKNLQLIEVVKIAVMK